MADLGLYRISQALGAVSQGMEFGGALAGMLDKEVKNKARADLNYINANLENDMNNFLLELEQSNDYSNWQEKADDFLEKRKSLLSDKNSPYYCSNDYTAKQADLMLLNARNGLQEKVARSALRMQMQETMVKDSNTLDMYKNLYSGQELIDKSTAIIDGEYKSGKLTPEQYDAKVKTIYKDAVYNSLSDIADVAIEDAINKGESFEKAWKKVKENSSNYSLKSAIDGTQQNWKKEEIENEAKKNAQQKYNNAVKNIQDQNANTLSEFLLEIENTDNPADKTSLAKQALSLMATQMGGLKLEETARNRYSSKFGNILDDIASGGDGTSLSGGSGSSNLESFSELIKLAPKSFIAKWKEGAFNNIYEMKEAFVDTIKKEYFGKNWKDVKDKSNDNFNLKYSYVFSKLIEEAVTEKLNTQDFRGIKKTYDDLVNDIQKHPKQYGDASIGNLSAFIYDWVANSKPGDTDEDFYNDLKKHIGACYLDKANYLTLNKKGEAKKKFKNDAKGIGQSAEFLQNNDVVFTDINGKAIWAKDAEKAITENIAPIQKEAVAKALGLSQKEADSKLSFTFTQTQNDMKPSLVFRYAGNSYIVQQSADKKGYIVVDQNGNYVKDPQTQINDAKKEAQKATEDFYDSRYKNVIENMSLPEELKKAGFTPEQWEKMSLNERRAQLEYYAIPIGR